MQQIQFGVQGMFEEQLNLQLPGTNLPGQAAQAGLIGIRGRAER